MCNYLIKSKSGWNTIQLYSRACWSELVTSVIARVGGQHRGKPRLTLESCVHLESLYLLHAFETSGQELVMIAM